MAYDSVFSFAAQNGERLQPILWQNYPKRLGGPDDQALTLMIPDMTRRISPETYGTCPPPGTSLKKSYDLQHWP